MPPVPPTSPTIVCLGEILWDSLPRGLFLGGAPFNVGYHLHRLGGHARIASRIGADSLGSVIQRRMREHSLSTDLLQSDGTHSTGLVHVSLDSAGNASYDIVRPAAWDFIEPTPALREAITAAAAVVFGSLAQREEMSRRTIQSIITSHLLRVFDVNLRPPFDSLEIVRFGLAHADVVKLNDDELRWLARHEGAPTSLREAAKYIADTYGCRMVCVTRGAIGAGLWHKGNWTEHPGFDVTVRDTVGAGDAFLAALVLGVLSEDDDAALLRNANALGAFVASQDGATPAYEPSILSHVCLTDRSGAS